MCGSFKSKNSRGGAHENLVKQQGISQGRTGGQNRSGHRHLVAFAIVPAQSSRPFFDTPCSQGAAGQNFARKRKTDLRLGG